MPTDDGVEGSGFNDDTNPVFRNIDQSYLALSPLSLDNSTGVLAVYVRFSITNFGTTTYASSSSWFPTLLSFGTFYADVFDIGFRRSTGAGTNMDQMTFTLADTNLRSDVVRFEFNRPYTIVATVLGTQRKIQLALLGKVYEVAIEGAGDVQPCECGAAFVHCRLICSNFTVLFSDRRSDVFR
jgi:hypothetical protein